MSCTAIYSRRNGSSKSYRNFGDRSFRRIVKKCKTTYCDPSFSKCRLIDTIAPEETSIVRWLLPRLLITSRSSKKEGKTLFGRIRASDKKASCDSSDRLRLYYERLSDLEISRLAEDLINLTDEARHRLHTEMAKRGLPPILQQSQSSTADTTESDQPLLTKTRVDDPQILLMTFVDSINAAQACGHLKEHDIRFDLKNLSKTIPRMKIGAGMPALMLEIYVFRSDWDKAVSVLREDMGLFPDWTITSELNYDSDGIEKIAVVGYFASYEEAEASTRKLNTAGIFHRLTRACNRSAAGEIVILLEVRDTDLLRAGEAIEALLT